MKRLGLTEEDIFGPGGLLLDQDGDGFPEGWGGWIVLPRRGPARLFAAAAELAVRAAQDLVALDGPVAVFEDELAGLEGAGLTGLRGSYLSLAGESGRSSAGGAAAALAAVRRLCGSGCPDGAGRERRAGSPSSAGMQDSSPSHVDQDLDITQFWTTAFLAQSASLFPVGHRLALHIPDEEMDGEEGKALVELGARYGLESAGLEYPVVLVGEEELPPARRPVLRLVRRGEGAKSGEATGGAAGAEGAGSGSARMVAPGVVEADAAGLRWLTALAAPSDPATWMAAHSAGSGEEPTTEPGTSGGAGVGRRAEAGRELVRGNACWEWEVAEAQEAFERLVSRVVAEGWEAVEVEARLSEPLYLRREIADRWRGALVEAGLPEAAVGVKVRSAYKQGLCWIEEEVVPAVRAFRGEVASVTVGFQPFVAPEGEKWLDLSTRWLQELYPADEKLAGALGLPWGAVTFAGISGDGGAGGPRYVVTAFGPGVAGQPGKVLWRDSFEISHAERLYLDAFPEAGKVHPPTGLMRWNATKDGGAGARGVSERGEVRIASDSERFWDYFQSKVLPAVTERVLTAGAGSKGSAPWPEDQPFFRRLDVHVWLSEPDDALGVREERLSPLEALHEDIYFVALDHFAHLGRQLVGAPYRSPGLIIPWIHRADGEPPRCEFSLEGWGESPPAPHSAGEDAGAGAGAATGAGAGAGPGPAGGTADGAPVSMCDVIGRDRLEATLAALAARPGLQVHRAGRSFLGDPSYVVEVGLPARGRISRRKLSLLKPTYVLVARHHANEVSSTNSALKLAELIAGDARYERHLRSLNLVIIPFENVDGAALHYELQREHPTWKLHAGRFNAAGQDLAAEYWKKGSAFGESAVLPRVWEAWLPDMVGDDHGVPSHEWEQPFSGYVCPWFSSFWLPRAHFYAYLSYLEDEEKGEVGTGGVGGGGFAPHRALVEAVRESVAAAVDGDPDIAALNRVWRDRYQKYGTAWLPDRFPAMEQDFHKDVLVYWTGIKPSATARNLAARHPEVTALSWVAEVNDETAQGAYLELCARAHLLADVAVLDVMLAAERAVEVVVEPLAAGNAGGATGGVRREWRRTRPLRAGPSNAGISR